MADDTIDAPKKARKGRDPERRKAWLIEYERKNRARINERMRIYRAQNSETLSEQAKLRRANRSPDQKRLDQERGANWRNNNLAKHRKAALDWAIANRPRARENKRRWEVNNPEKKKESARNSRNSRKTVINQKRKDGWDKNKDDLNRRKRELYAENVEHHRAWRRNYIRERQARDINYKLRRTITARLNIAIRSNTKTGSAIRALGCPIEDFKRYIEAKFTSGMTWKNWGRKGWHLDHIKPLASFDLTDRDQFLKACHFTNYQPLWWHANLSKGARLPTTLG